MKMDIAVAEMPEGDCFGARPVRLDPGHGGGNELGHPLYRDRDIVLDCRTLGSLGRGNLIPDSPERFRLCFIGGNGRILNQPRLERSGERIFRQFPKRAVRSAFCHQFDQRVP